MSKSKEIAQATWSDESGQDLIEYALVACLIGLAAITSMKGVATSLKSAYSGIGSTLATYL